MPWHGHGRPSRARPTHRVSDSLAIAIMTKKDLKNENEHMVLKNPQLAVAKRHTPKENLHLLASAAKTAAPLPPARAPQKQVSW